MNRRGFLRWGAALAMPLFVRKSRGEQRREEEIVASVKELMPKLMQEANVPGLSLSLVNAGRVLWHGGFGVRDNTTKTPVTDDTLFEAASVSKTVFAYKVMALCEAGILDLDRPLSRYGATPLLNDDPRMEQITARHVLSHTSGFQDFRSQKEPLRIHFDPGTKFMYSGEGYYYLQSTVTHLTGKVDCTVCATYEAGLEVCGTDFDDYMKRTLLRPLRMNTSGYLWNDVLAKNSASPHDINGKASAKKKPSRPDIARYGACGDLHTTASEYAKFLLAVIDPAASRASLLSQRSVKEMLRPQIRLPDDQKIDGADSWALGWAIQRRKTGNVIVHSGGQAGFQSLTMSSVDRKSGFVALTNSENGWKIFHDSRFSAEMDRLVASPL